MLYYEVLNNNKEKWVMMLHCICSNRTIFYNQIEEYSKYYNLILVDLPGHGKSSRYPLKFDYKDIIFDLVSILNELKIEKVNIVSLSLGAIIASYFTYLKPNRVDKLIFEGITAGFSIPVTKYMFLLFSKIKKAIPKKLYLKVIFYLIIPGKKYKKFRDELIKNALIMNKSHLFEWFNLISKYFFDFDKIIKDDLLKSTHLKLFIMGKNDYMFLGKVKKDIPNSLYNKVVVLDKCGHFCNIDCKEEFSKITVKFLNNYQKYYRESIYQKII